MGNVAVLWESSLLSSYLKALPPLALTDIPLRRTLIRQTYEFRSWAQLGNGNRNGPKHSLFVLRADPLCWAEPGPGECSNCPTRHQNSVALGALLNRWR